VTKVYDGDTINIITRLGRWEKYYEYSLRIAGIDAPEVRPQLTTEHRELHKAAGYAVRDRLAQLIPVNSYVYVAFYKEEKYGRLLGSVWTLEPCCTRSCLRGFSRFGFGPYPGFQCCEVAGMNVAEQLLEEEMVLPYDGKTKVMFSVEQLHKIAETTKYVGHP
jgi:endonuclease YncB( thermonuclease family)